MGRPLTQSLFLETHYDKDVAVYTLKDDDFEYKDKKFLSLKRLYLEMGDPTEYTFANTYLLGWSHWKRIKQNNLYTEMMEQWSEELEVKMMSEMVGRTMDMAYDEEKPNMAAVKFIADKGWSKRKAGRPSKDDIAKERRIAAAVEEEYAADANRLRAVK